MMRRRLGNKPLEADVERARVWFTAPGTGAGPAPNDAQYLTLATNADLVNERVFTVGDGLDEVDAGGGSTYTVSVDVTDFIDTDYGLTEDTNNIRVNAGDGLAFDTGALVVDLVDAWSGLEFDSGDLRVDQDAEFTWTATHTHQADIILDDGSGDSPAVRFVGGSHNDEARIFLVDDGTAGDSDLAVRLCDAAGDSRFIIQTNAGAEIAHVDSLGGASFQAGMVVNESGDDHDSRVEGATLVNLIYVDAGADRVYVNSAAGDANVTGFDSNVRVLVFDNLAVSREGPAYVSAFTYSNTGTDVTAFRGRRARGTRASPAAPQSGDRLVRFGGAGYDGSNFLSSNAYFDMYAAENFSGTNQGAEIRAYTTANGSTVPLERMRWADDGNVGLNETTPSWGVASPERTFHLSYSGDGFPALVLERTNGSSYTNRKFSWYVGSSGALTLYDHTGSAVRWVVEAGGNVGIGSSDPDTRLDVNGAITFRELSSDPSDPDEGCAVLWMGDGGGTGDDGDILLKITTGGSTKTTTLVDFSAI